jgi:hypothetical protein
MHRGTSSRRQRLALRTLARQLLTEDPELARLLSHRRLRQLRPLRVSSVPVVGYLIAGVLMFMVGCYLEVGSAVLFGLAMFVLAAVRHRAKPTPPRGVSPLPTKRPHTDNGPLAP